MWDDVCEAATDWLSMTGHTGFVAMVLVTAYHKFYVLEDVVPIHELGLAMGAAGTLVLVGQALNVAWKWYRRPYAFLSMTPMTPEDVEQWKRTHDTAHGWTIDADEVD